MNTNYMVAAFGAMLFIVIGGLFYGIARTEGAQIDYLLPFLAGFILFLILVFIPNKTNTRGVSWPHSVIFWTMAAVFLVSGYSLFFAPILPIEYLAIIAAFSGGYVFRYYRNWNDLRNFASPQGGQVFSPFGRVVFFMVGQILLFFIFSSIIYTNYSNPTFPFWVFGLFIGISFVSCLATAYKYLQFKKSKQQ